ncbi:MAG: PAS domain S-box protein [Actinomycetota bacterium]|nr:PAS domain S-box protein [Actinomycetota bacterium]
MKSKENTSNYVENAPIGVFVVDEKGKYVDVNKAATIITGYSSEEILKMSIRDISAEETWKSTEVGFATLLKTGVMSAELQYVHKNGYKRWWNIDAVKLDENRYLGFASDITDRKKAESKLLYLSYHDHLTDIHNRRYYEQELKNFDTAENLPLSIIMCDVNGLKLVNDSFGHDAGDTSCLKRQRKQSKRYVVKKTLLPESGGRVCSSIT